MNNYCYFLIYRSPYGQKFNWNKPTGGLVIEPVGGFDGEFWADMDDVDDLIDARYECAPHEQIVIAEVFERREKRMAVRLHRRWEREMREFVEMMT